MNPSLWRTVVTLALSLVGAAASAAGDSFPSRPVRIIVNTAPGGLVDISARLLGQHMSDYLKQPVIVENRPGGDGLIGIRAVKAAPADGYTLLASAGTMALQMAMRVDPGYDLTRDFTGIGMMARAPYLMVVAAGQPDHTLGEFIQRAKANPGKLTFSSAGTGSVPHLTGERFMSQTGVKLTHVPYKGSGQSAVDVMAGRIDTTFKMYGGASGSIKAGQERVLGVAAPRRLASLPDVPTFAEQGVNMTAYSWMALVAPAGTPPDAVKQLSEALRFALNQKAIRDRYRDEGTEGDFMAPDELNRFLAREVADGHKLVKDLALPQQQ